MNFLFFCVTEGFMDWIVCLNVATLATEDGVKMNVTVIKNFRNSSTGCKVVLIKIDCLQKFFSI